MSPACALCWWDPRQGTVQGSAAHLGDRNVIPEPLGWAESRGEEEGAVMHVCRCSRDPRKGQVPLLPSPQGLGTDCAAKPEAEWLRRALNAWSRSGWEGHPGAAAEGLQQAGGDCAPPPRPLERGWRKQKEGGAAVPQPKVRLRQEVVSTAGQRRGQRIAMPVRKFFAREKRPYGLGMVGRLTNRTYRKRIDSYVKRQIEDMDDHR